jgi:hypothetical protein
VTDYAPKQHLRAPFTINICRVILRLRIWLCERDVDNIDHLIDRINWERSRLLHERAESDAELKRLRGML